MSKKFDICLTKPLMEFDIHFKDSRTDGDIIIHSLPYRDFLSVSNDIILKAHIHNSDEGVTVKRYRLLTDMDEVSLAEFDSMTLENADFVILQ